MPRIEAPAPAPVADGKWRPKWIEDRGAFICLRFTVPPAGKGLCAETHGARLNGRFSPLYLFREEDARAQCDTLNRIQGEP